MREKDLQQAITDLARLTGWLAYHTYDSRRSEPGFPDLVLVHPGQGRVLYRELKAERGRLSPAQRRWLNALHAAGQDADVWRPNQWPEHIRAELTGQDDSDPDCTDDDCPVHPPADGADVRSVGRAREGATS